MNDKERAVLQRLLEVAGRTPHGYNAHQAIREARRLLDPDLHTNFADMTPEQKARIRTRGFFIPGEP